MRRTNDFYETAPWQVDAMVDHLPELSGTVVCPCVGDGSLMNQLAIRRPDLTFITNDIDETKPAQSHYDARDPLYWAWLRHHFGKPDWVVDNPPFAAEHSIAQRAYDAASKGVVLMSRVSYVEGTLDRGLWLSTHSRIKQIVLERYSFTGNGSSDSATTEWLVWAKPGVTIANPGGHTTFGYKPRRGR